MHSPIWSSSVFGTKMTGIPLMDSQLTISYLAHRIAIEVHVCCFDFTNHLLLRKTNWTTSSTGLLLHRLWHVAETVKLIDTTNWCRRTISRRFWTKLALLRRLKRTTSSGTVMLLFAVGKEVARMISKLNPHYCLKLIKAYFLESHLRFLLIFLQITQQIAKPIFGCS